jgi:hypothetical protein
MEEILLKQLVRQMKILNFWITFFGMLFIATVIIGGILLYKAVTYIHHVDQSIQNLQQKTSQTLDVQQQLCNSSLAKTLSSSCK